LIFCAIINIIYADVAVQDEEENTNPAHTQPEDNSASADDSVPSEDDLAEEDDDDEEDEIEAKPAGTEKNKTKDEVKQPNWDGRVMELTMDDFDYFTNQFESLMVNIYAPWCNHCQDFAPIYDEAGQRLFDSVPRYFLAKIDGSKYPELKNRFEIPGYPTLFHFKRGRPHKYDGQMTVKGIVDYIKKHSPETVQKLGCGQLAEQKRREN
jgi:thiol-disulfide isomerase/thioredoxin